MSAEHTQYKNFILTMQLAVHYKYRRALIIIDSGSGTKEDIRELCEHCGFEIATTESASGKGKKFNGVLVKYSDATYTTPMAIVCFVHQKEITVGTDLADTDFMCFFGKIPEEDATQIHGRVLRPLPSRGFRSIPSVNFYLTKQDKKRKRDDEPKSEPKSEPMSES